MIITLPKDIIEIKMRSYRIGIKAFRFRQQLNKLTVPQDIRKTFEGSGVDMFVSPSEKCLYLTFVNKQKAQFKVNPANGQISCKDLFVWIRNAQVPVFDNYLYDDYQVDTKNKIVKLNLVRK